MPDQWSFRTYMVYVYPVLDVSKYCHGLMGRVGYYYRMSSSYYYSFGDGDSIIVEVNEPPQEFISVPKFDEVDFVENDEPQETSYSGEKSVFATTVPCGMKFFAGCNFHEFHRFSNDPGKLDHIKTNSCEKKKYTKIYSI